MADVYAEKATWFTGMANEVRRLSETEDKLTPAEMLAKMEKLEAGKPWPYRYGESVNELASPTVYICAIPVTNNAVLCAPTVIIKEEK